MAEQSRPEILARRYAEAVFAIAREHRTEDQWRDDLRSLADLVRHPQAGRFLTSFRVRREEKRRLLERALDVSPLAMNLALLLLQRERLALAPRIAAAYEHMLDAARGVAHAEVTTAVPLAPEDERTVAEHLRRLTGAREVRLTTRVDPAIIGGVIARLGDRLIDGSTRTRLIQLRRTLAGEVT
ncbi:MAG: F0F1 ATP synthase subunit delta [Chloroflexota bacterium]